MADIILNRPEQGQTVRIVTPTGNHKIILNFLAEETALDRVDDNLVFEFENGASLHLQNFFLESSKENLPQFQIKDVIIEGIQFFKALDPDVFPSSSAWSLTDVGLDTGEAAGINMGKNDWRFTTWEDNGENALDRVAAVANDLWMDIQAVGNEILIKSDAG